MVKSRNTPVGRRGFLKGAAASAAGLASGTHVAHAHSHQDHDHEHQAVPSDVTLRVKALESLLVEKGLVDRAALDAVVDAYETKIGPVIRWSGRQRSNASCGRCSESQPAARDRSSRLAAWRHAGARHYE
jgi:hypothetical protein